MNSRSHYHSMKIMKFAGISKINIKNFKSIRDAELDISPITILAGANSSGNLA